MGVGAVSSSKNIMGFFGKTAQAGEAAGDNNEEHNKSDQGEPLSRQMSESSTVYATDQEEDDEYGAKLQLGPQYTLKEQLEKDKVN